jgi:hypothetical protein
MATATVEERLATLESHLDTLQRQFEAQTVQPQKKRKTGLAGYRRHVPQ